MVDLIDNTRLCSQNGGGIASSYSYTGSLLAFKINDLEIELRHTLVKNVLIFSALFFATVKSRKAVA